jgi:hypothetical protein
MSRLLKLWIATSFTWALFVVTMIAVANIARSLFTTSESIGLFAIYWGGPSLLVLVIGSVFRWALK